MPLKVLSKLRNSIVNIYFQRVRTYIYFLVYYSYYSRNSGRSYILQATRLCPKNIIIALEEDGETRLPSLEKKCITYLIRKNSTLKINICYKGGEIEINRSMLFRKPINHLIIILFLCLFAGLILIIKKAF